MGMASIVYIPHDQVHLIEKDPEFGKKLARACTSSRRAGQNVEHFSLSGVKVIGQYFHVTDINIIVAEGGTAWQASFQQKPDWSKLTQERALRMIFGHPKTRTKGGNTFKRK